MVHRFGHDALFMCLMCIRPKPCSASRESSRQVASTEELIIAFPAECDLQLAVEIWRSPLQHTAGEDASEDDGKEEDDAEEEEKKEEEKDSSYKIQQPSPDRWGMNSKRTS